MPVEWIFKCLGLSRIIFYVLSLTALFYVLPNSRELKFGPILHEYGSSWIEVERFQDPPQAFVIDIRLTINIRMFSSAVA